MSVLHAHIPVSEKERLRILAHLEELLESPAFASSRRRQAFLRYVVQETLAGRGSAIKEANIAVDVFGRSNDFDAQTASIVRVTAAEVRKRLTQAYEAEAGWDLRIELPLGGYQPAFHFLAAEEIRHNPLLSIEAESPAAPHRRLWPILAVAGCLLAAASVFLALRLARPSSPTDIVWQPFLDRNNPVLISLMVPSVLSTRHKVNWLPLQPGAMIPADDLVMQDAPYTGIGGALGAARFAEQLAFRHQPFYLRFGGDVAFADLKSSAAILLGPSRWTKELLRTLRFRMEVGPETKTIIDSQVPGRLWRVPRALASEPVEGYSLITRLLHSDSGHPVMLVLGMDTRDTQSAVEFLSSDQYLGPFLKKMPAGWENKSFQVVLHNSVHGNTPGSLTVIASHVW